MQLVKANYKAKEKQPHSTHYATALKSIFCFARLETLYFYFLMGLQVHYNIGVTREFKAKKLLIYLF